MYTSRLHRGALTRTVDRIPRHGSRCREADRHVVYGSRRRPTNSLQRFLPAGAQLQKFSAQLQVLLTASCKPQARCGSRSPHRERDDTTRGREPAAAATHAAALAHSVATAAAAGITNCRAFASARAAACSRFGLARISAYHARPRGGSERGSSAARRRKARCAPSAPRLSRCLHALPGACRSDVAISSAQGWTPSWLWQSEGTSAVPFVRAETLFVA